MKPAEVDGGPGRKLNVGSIWDILQHGLAVDPNRTALIVPAQKSNHLAKLKRPFGNPEYDRALCGLGSNGLLPRWLSPSIMLGSLLSWFLPAPGKLDCLTWSFADLERAAVRLASALETIDIKPGSTILIILPPCVEWALMLWVCAFKCHTFVTVDMMVLQDGNDDLLREHMRQLSPSVVMVANASEAARIEACADARQTSFIGITTDDSEKVYNARWSSLSQLSNFEIPESMDLQPVKDTPDRVAMVIYTSGTTNRKPKGCLRTVEELLTPFTITGSIPPVKPPMALVNSKSYQAGAPCVLNATWYSGNAITLVSGITDAGATLSGIALTRPMSISLMVHISENMRAHPAYTPEKVKSLKLVQLIGSTVTVQSLKRAQQTFPNAKVVAAYGMTEAACMIGWPKGMPTMDKVPKYKGVSASGYILPGSRLKLVDQNGKVIGRNTPGTMHLSGHMVTKGYLEGRNSELFYEDEHGVPWYATTDCAVMDDDGAIYILGRSDSVVVRDGVSVAAATTQNLLEEKFPDAKVCLLLTMRQWAFTPTTRPI